MKEPEVLGLEELSGFVSHITYRNTENGYTVFGFISEGEEQTCVGTFHLLEEGMCLKLKGTYTMHPSYGQQLKVEQYEETAPQDAASMERYLGSGAVKGVGVALAARIVRRFKSDTFRILEEEPERLAEIKGISNRMAMEIARQVEGKKEVRQAMMFLQQFGISMNLGIKIYNAYGMELYRIINENPYRLADDMQGVGFRIADEIARRVGIHTDSDFRIRSGILYVLQQGTTQGHTFLPQEVLTRQAVELLGVERQYVEQHYENLAMDKKIIIKEVQTDQGSLRQIYASSYYYMELNTATMLRDLGYAIEIADIELMAQVRKVEKEIDINLDEMQVLAVKKAITSGLLVITGGPGTGKTTTINSIIKYFENQGMDLLLAAPTGRAAKRMSEMTGYQAKTIHRMLELNGGKEGNAGFERNEQNPLEADVVIIDEMSMVDITLMYALLKAIIPGTRLILVGDAYQLPSVGPGTVLKDIIDSGCCQVVELKKIFRQASQSSIVVNAHKINGGEPVSLDNKNMDFFFLKRLDADVIIAVMLKLIQEKLPKYVNASSYDIQVLTPMRKGLLGVERLNGILQRYLNPPGPGKKEKDHGQIVFREGDKVMQIKNNYQMEWEVTNQYGIQIERGMGVFNGDTGIIKSINLFAETLELEFDEGRKVIYNFKQLDELELAYAVTVHKSQGSEYPAVIIPLLSGPRLLMNRNLLYTAVTRAKKCVTIVGNDATFYEMVANVSEQKRYSGLNDRLMEEEKRFSDM
ncbi:MAG: ATP-dependent RecD-like DNA helicase [Lachnospiraceae bacterium]